MQALQKYVRLLELSHPFHVQTATIMKLKKPPNYDHVEYPERRRFRLLDKVPEPLSALRAQTKMPKGRELIRGPELVHNKIIYGEYAIQALEGGRLKSAHLDTIRLSVIRNMNQKKSFVVWRIDAPWYPVTKKGLGQRMGSGKPAIKNFVTPIKSQRIFLEMGGEVEFGEIMPILETVVTKLPFKARIVSRESLEELNTEEERLEKLNLNPFTFKYCADNNMLGIKKWLSPYDYLWYGKYK